MPGAGSVPFWKYSLIYRIEHDEGAAAEQCYIGEVSICDKRQAEDGLTP